MLFISGLFARRSSGKLSLVENNIIKFAFTKNRTRIQAIHKKIHYTASIKKPGFQSMKKGLYAFILGSAPLERYFH
jgi:hypothetical protein